MVKNIFGEIRLNPDHRVNAFCLALFIKLYGTVHGAMIGDGKVLHPKLFCSPDEFFHSAESVEQGIFCMNMGMYKISIIHKNTKPPLFKKSALSIVLKKRQGRKARKYFCFSG